ncbi:hypothetical protein GWI68_08980 [Proteus sp. G2669]|uniref:hypothetical protein n=1 Tax=Proteus sp. G2669 TaxID=2698881 RepID=UPI0014135A74|nr:hypothetical protein [Proteus sp. G2669]NBM54918.1 hypothetical protein [Proteus sp. G2669]
MAEENPKKQNKKAKSRKVRLRAFKIENKELSSNKSPAKGLILEKLENTIKVKDRCMLLNSEDPSQEQDLISCYEISTKSNSVFCTMLRITPSNELEQIPDKLFEKKDFTLDELESSKIDSLVVCKNHFYFCINDKYLITNLPLRTTIASLQTYICWLTKNELLEFTPMIDIQNQTQLKDLSAISVKDSEPIKLGDPLSSNDTTEEKKHTVTVVEEKSKKIRLDHIVMHAIKASLSKSSSLKELMDNKIVSAELLIKFSKPRKMTDGDYANILGATLKPVSDLDNVTFKRKDGKTEIKGKDLLKTKFVDIELTDTGKLNEQMLFQEMSRYLIDIERENPNI